MFPYRDDALEVLQVMRELFLHVVRLDRHSDASTVHRQVQLPKALPGQRHRGQHVRLRRHLEDQRYTCVLYNGLGYNTFTKVAAETLGTHISRCEGTAVTEAGREGVTVRGGEVEDHRARSVLHQPLHGGSAEPGRSSGDEPHHALTSTTT